MSAFLLIALLAVALFLQIRSDIGRIGGLVRERRWSDAEVRWAPLVGLLTGTRRERCYWLRYQDEDGRASRRLCRLSGLFGAAGVVLEPATVERGARGAVAVAPAPPLGRASAAVLFGLCGLFAGTALGIAASFVLFPSSNVAPAYGVLCGGPLGLLAGVVVALQRAR
jgi:hypothetical protein